MEALQEDALTRQILDFNAHTAPDNVFCEMVSGRIISRAAPAEEGRRLLFLLGTLLEDYIVSSQPAWKIVFGPKILPVTTGNIFSTDLYICAGEEEDTIPLLAVNIMSDSLALYDSLDKAAAYREAGTQEYWLIDLTRQDVFVYDFGGDGSFRRLSFEQRVYSRLCPGFDFVLSDIMWKDEGCLRELAVFYRFRKELQPRYQNMLMAEDEGIYEDGEGTDRKYTARQFYEWLKTRRNRPDYARTAQLLLGDIRLMRLPRFRHQFIQGNLYFAVKTFLENHSLPFEICFSPMAVELCSGGILDSVVRPDIFLIEAGADIPDDVYRGVPLWIAEIADPSSAAQDYVDKAQLYHYHGVREYWVINDWKRQVMVIRCGEDKDLPGGADMKKAVP